jgi:hypothetical protein
MSKPYSPVAGGLLLESVTDADLVRAARQDRAAFAPLYRRCHHYYPPCLDCLAGAVGN